MITFTEDEKKIILAYCDRAEQMYPRKNPQTGTEQIHRHELLTWARFYAAIREKIAEGDGRLGDEVQLEELTATAIVLNDIGCKKSFAVFVLIPVYQRAQIASRLAEDMPTFVPTKTRTPIDKLTKSFFNYPWDEGDNTADIGIGKYGNAPNIRLVINGFPAELNAFDKEVFLRVAARYAAGNMYVTAAQICRDIGMYNCKKNREQVDASIDRMAGIRLSIDMTKLAGHYKGFHEEEGDKLIAKGYLLAAESVTEIKVRHQTARTAWLVMKYPVLLEFGERTGQFVELPYKAAQLPSDLRIDETVLRVNDYLRTRLVSNELSNKILLSSLIEECYDKPTRKPRVIALVDRLLDHYKSTGVIKAYKKCDNGDYYTFTRVVHK